MDYQASKANTDGPWHAVNATTRLRPGLSYSALCGVIVTDHAGPWESVEKRHCRRCQGILAATDPPAAAPRATTPLDGLRRAVRVYMAERDLPSFAALARILRDATHPRGWSPSSVHSVLSGERPSRALMSALAELRLEDGTPIPACGACGWATCPGCGADDPGSHS